MILNTVHHLLEKLRFLFVLRSVNSFAMSMVESLSVLSLCMFKTVRLLIVPGSFLNGAMFLASGQSKRIFHRLHWLLDLQESAYIT